MSMSISPGNHNLHGLAKDTSLGPNSLQSYSSGQSSTSTISASAFRNDFGAAEEGSGRSTLGKIGLYLGVGHVVECFSHLSAGVQMLRNGNFRQATGEFAEAALHGFCGALTVGGAVGMIGGLAASSPWAVPFALMLGSSFILSYQTDGYERTRRTARSQYIGEGAATDALKKLDFDSAPTSPQGFMTVLDSRRGKDALRVELGDALKEQVRFPGTRHDEFLRNGIAEGAEERLITALAKHSGIKNREDPSINQFRGLVKQLVGDALGCHITA